MAAELGQKKLAKALLHKIKDFFLQLQVDWPQVGRISWKESITAYEGDIKAIPRIGSLLKYLRLAAELKSEIEFNSSFF